MEIIGKKAVRTVISKSAKRSKIETIHGFFPFFTEQVVYKTPIGKVKGKIKYKSITKHEPILNL